MSNLKSLGIPGLPSSIDILLKGSIYAAIVDSIPAHLSIIIQALKANIAAGNTCVLLTQMTPGIFLSRAKMSGVDFSEDISQNRLYFFSQEGDYVTNIFRHGIKRFLKEFEYFRVPNESFFLFDQAGELFTMSDQNIAQAQAIEYRDWMRSSGNTSFFLFPAKGEKRSQSILSSFSGVARINQSKTGLELLIDFWYSQDGAIAAKAFPVSLDTTGLIRVDASLPQTAIEAYQTDSNTDDDNAVFYFGPDFETFSASVQHSGEWVQAQSFVDLIHLSRDAARATVVLSFDSDTELKQTAKIVHYLRLNWGNRLRIVIRESGFSLRYLNELLLLRLGVNLIIHQQVARQQLPLLWEMLAGQTYTRKINQDFDQAYSNILSSEHTGYIDLVSFCSEALGIFDRGDILDIPLTLIVASYHEQASPPDILSQVKIVRNGDIFSSNATHCYIFMHACTEENSAAALSRITGNKHASLFLAIRFITAKKSIRETLQHLVQSGDIALAPDFSEAIAEANRTHELIEATITEMPLSPPPGASPDNQKLNSDEQVTVPGEDTQAVGSAAEQSLFEMPPQTEEEPSELEKIMHRLASQPPSQPPVESMAWIQK
jgi:cellulose biosynthesis protein BcsE